MSCGKLHLASFAALILVTLLIAHFWNSFPYNFIALCVWLVALIWTVTSAVAIMLRNEIRSESEATVQNIQLENSVDILPPTAALEIRGSGIEILSKEVNPSISIQSVFLKKAGQVIAAGLISISISLSLINLGLHRASYIIQAEAAVSVWRPTFVVCWIFTGIVDMLPCTERQHRFPKLVSTSRFLK